LSLSCPSLVPLLSLSCPSLLLPFSLIPPAFYPSPLPQVDALKEFAYEKLIDRIFEIQNRKLEDESKHASTVKYYAIVDTQLR
jgi:hypothetical protein